MKRPSPGRRQRRVRRRITARTTRDSRHVHRRDIELHGCVGEDRAKLVGLILQDVLRVRLACGELLEGQVRTRPDGLAL
jgi:hypothetical protein